ncbi:hypothetical protein IFM89_035932 [Coptis chinensis]|uniref:Uncharacterized protein n=1 Tax=Coptis chinensis TaxID=261450 RepID=A0A835H1J8_9MAGN|nr:hypothetical protein IFM89_035932 [Coptis chinensis]
MASISLSFQLSSVHKASLSPKLDVGRTSLPSAFDVKPFLKELLHVPTGLNVSRTIKDTSRRLLNAFVDSVFQFVDIPYLPNERNFAPTEETGQATTVVNIEGEIPIDFPMGVYLRNGPNPLFGGLKSAVSIFGKASNIWVEGEGMVHALYFTKDSEDCWKVVYNNRFVESLSYIAEKKETKPYFLPAVEGDSPAIIAAYVLNSLRFGKPNKDLSSTNIFEHSGKIYSVTEDHLPHEIDIFTLEKIVADWAVEKSWGRPFTSHPKKAPGTGELVTIGMDALKPFCVLGIVSADGKKILHKANLKLDRSCFVHEIGITEKYNVIINCPLTIDINRLVKGGPLIKFNKEDFTMIGVMPRYGDANSIRWFEVASTCTFHILNCFEDGDEVIVRGCRAQESVIPGPRMNDDRVEWFTRGLKPIDHCEENGNEVGEIFSRIYEWRLNMKTGEVKEKNLTGTSFPLDFPMINEKYTGVKNKYGYAQVVDASACSNFGFKYGMLAKLYLEELSTRPSEMMEHSESEELIKVEYHKLGENTFCSGATFVPKQGSQDEDDGWIVSFVHNEDTNVSQAHIIDTQSFEAEPVAKITLPRRVPYGFHGTYVSRPFHIQQVLKV